jgi:hypothetical protein
LVGEYFLSLAEGFFFFPHLKQNTMKELEPDFSVFRSGGPAHPPGWLETRLMARVMASRSQTFSANPVRLWRNLALAVLVLHLISVGIVLSNISDSSTNSINDTTGQATEFFAANTYSYSW